MSTDTNKNKELRDRVFGWLDEEGFKTQIISNPKDAFAFMSELPNKKQLIVTQPISSFDKIIISSGFNLTHSQQSTLSAITPEKRDEIFQEILLGLFGLRVECGPFTLPLVPNVYKSIYADGLNKNVFMGAFLDVHNAMWFVGLTLAKRLDSTSPDISVSHIYD